MSQPLSVVEEHVPHVPHLSSQNESFQNQSSSNDSQKDSEIQRREIPQEQVFKQKQMIFITHKTSTGMFDKVNL
jgi:hypothetical protein